MSLSKDDLKVIAGLIAAANNSETPEEKPNRAARRAAKSKKKAPAKKSKASPKKLPFFSGFEGSKGEFVPMVYQGENKFTSIKASKNLVRFILENGKAMSEWVNTDDDILEMEWLDEED